MTSLPDALIHGRNRRAFLRLAALGSVGTLLAACSPAAPASPTAAPTAAPAATGAAKPSSSPEPRSGAVASPSAIASPSAAAAGSSPTVNPNWQAEWDRTLAAARQEGVVVVAGPPGDVFRGALTRFSATYPDIRLEYTGVSGRDFAPKVIAERQAGQYLVDIHVGGTGTGKQLKDLGFWDPFKPNLIRPDVLDSSKWLGGFEAGMMDTEATYAYGFEANARPVAYVNRDVVPESQLARVEQLLEPQWKGKISWNDPRQPSGGASTAGHILMAYGEDFLRKLLQQNIANTADLRQQVEWIVRGTNPVAIGMDETSLVPFLQQGLGKNVVPLEPEGANSIRIEVGFGAAFLFKNAPHPNTSKVYLNWLLSQEGQQAWTITERASRRLDVNNPVERAPKQNRTYQPTVNHETNYRFQERAQQIAAEYLK